MKGSPSAPNTAFEGVSDDQNLQSRRSTSKEQRSTYNISPPTIPRSNVSDAARVFSGAFSSPVTQESLSSSSPSPHQIHAYNNQFYPIGRSLSPNTMRQTIAQPNQPTASLSQVPLCQVISSSAEVFQRNFNAPCNDEQSNQENSFDRELVIPNQHFLPMSPGLSSIAELSSFQQDNLFRPLETPRLRPASSTSMESAESSESLTSIQRIALSRGSGRKRNRRRSNASPTQSQMICGVADKEKSPPPQNLRGDPFRSAKVKTELCRYFNSEKGCPFGNKCNYAHGEDELKYTKLMDLKRAGLIDIEIFRTHPCLTWVSTGACPFDHRCMGLHDPSVIGNQNHRAWLPHAETAANSVGSGANVDHFYHERLASVYNCCPIFGYTPKRRWKAEPNDTDYDWNHFYSFVCNINNEFPDRQNLKKAFVLKIVLKMREKKAGRSYTYVPTHIFCGELCMILQVRFFRTTLIQHNGNTMQKVDEVFQAEIDDLIKQTLHLPDNYFEIHELAFGPVGDPSVRPISIWFDITKTDISPCTQQQAKHQKRSRHRLKSPRVRGGKNDGTMKQNESVQNTFFYHYQPRDDECFQLISEALSHRFQVLTFLSGKFDAVTTKQIIKLLESEFLRLKTIFASLSRFWMTWSWPFKLLGRVHDDTDVPPIDSSYIFFLGSARNFYYDVFFGVDDPNKEDLISPSLKLLPCLLWRSFMINVQLIQGKKWKDISETIKTPYDSRISDLRRLPILRHLSLGESLHESRDLPILKKSSKSRKDSQDKIDAILSEWKLIENDYTKNVTSITLSRP